MQVKVAQTENTDSMPPSMLVSATYDSISKSAVLKFYEPKSKKIILWRDETGHKPHAIAISKPVLAEDRSTSIGYRPVKQAQQ